MLRSSILGVISSLIMGLSLFVPFRLGIETLGPTKMGAWAFIQGLFVISRLPEMGVGVNITRDIAQSSKTMKAVAPAGYVVSSFLITVMPVTAMGLLIFIASPFVVLPNLDAQLSSHEIWWISFFSMAAAILTTIGTVFLSILEGYGHLSARHTVNIASNLILIFVSLPLIKLQGIIGLATSYMVAALATAVISAIVLPKNAAQGPLNSTTVADLVTRLWQANLEVSTMALTRMTFEPFTKFLIAFSGGLSLVAYIDIAMKLTAQVRIIIQAAVQPLLVFGARSKDDPENLVIPKFSYAQELVDRVVLITISCQIFCAATVSYLALGQFSVSFVVVYVILTIGNGLNSIGVVGYYFEISSGETRKILLIHVRMMALNITLGLGLALSVGSFGPIIAYALSFAFGGLALLECWRSAVGQSRKDYFLANWKLIFLVLLACGFTSWSHVIASAEGQDIFATVGFGIASAMMSWLGFDSWRALRRRRL